VAVSAWLILGICALLIGVPLKLGFTAGDYLIGAGVAFVVVGISQWVWNLRLELGDLSHWQ
jgi:hypothetical protein